MEDRAGPRGQHQVSVHLGSRWSDSQQQPGGETLRHFFENLKIFDLLRKFKSTFRYFTCFPFFWRAKFSFSPQFPPSPDRRSPGCRPWRSSQKPPFSSSKGLIGNYLHLFPFICFHLDLVFALPPAKSRTTRAAAPVQNLQKRRSAAAHAANSKSSFPFK